MQLIPPGQNGRHFGRWSFQMHFTEWKWYNYDSRFTKICSPESNSPQVSIGSGNDLVLNRRKAIAWTNAYLVHWLIDAALGGDELIREGFEAWLLICWREWCIHYYQCRVLAVFTWQIAIAICQPTYVCTGYMCSFKWCWQLSSQRHLWLILLKSCHRPSATSRHPVLMINRSHLLCICEVFQPSWAMSYISHFLAAKFEPSIIFLA